MFLHNKFEKIRNVIEKNTYKLFCYRLKERDKTTTMTTQST